MVHLRLGRALFGGVGEVIGIVVGVESRTWMIAMDFGGGVVPEIGGGITGTGITNSIDGIAVMTVISDQNTMTVSDLLTIGGDLVPFNRAPVSAIERRPFPHQGRRRFLLDLVP